MVQQNFFSVADWLDWTIGNSESYFVLETLVKLSNDSTHIYGDNKTTIKNDSQNMIIPGLIFVTIHLFPNGQHGVVNTTNQ